MTSQQRKLRKRKADLRWKKNNPEKHREMRRRAQLKFAYGITVEQYDEALKNQDGRCAICGRKTADSATGRKLCVDHDHKTKKFRGLLCRVCNTGIGHFQENLVLLKKAVEYLEKFQ